MTFSHTPFLFYFPILRRQNDFFLADFLGFLFLGLVSGLAPRLVMYVSQGALFFASYEFFKKFLSLDTALPETESIGFKEKKREKSYIPASPLSQKPWVVVS